MSEQSKVISFRNGADFLRECAARYADSDPLRALDFLRRARETAPEDGSIDREEADVLNRMGCPYEAVLALARSTALEELPGASWFDLAGSLISMGLMPPALDALRRYLDSEPAGENADSARELLALIYLSQEARLGKRSACFAGGLAGQAARLIREERYDRAERLIERGLSWCEEDRQLRVMKVKCCLYTGREEEARALAAELIRNEFADDLLTLALVLSEKPGSDELIEKILGCYLPGVLEPEVRLAILRVCLNREDEERIRSLLPGLLRDAPYDRGVLHAAAMGTLKSGQRRESAEWYWRRMLRVRETDGLAQQCLRQMEAEGSWRMCLPEGRTEQLRAACMQPGERLMELAHWALDAQESGALCTLCDALAQSPEREAEFILREALAHPQMEAAVKRRAFEVLKQRGAREPYLLITQEGVKLLSGEYQPIVRLPRSLMRVRECAEAALEQLTAERGAQEVLRRLWAAAIESREARRLLRRGGQGLAALLALTLLRCGRTEALRRLADCCGLSEQRLRLDAARLGAMIHRAEKTKIQEALKSDEAD